jgi:hypothetical protein
MENSEGHDGLHHEIADEDFAITEADKALNRTFHGE